MTIDDQIRYENRYTISREKLPNISLIISQSWELYLTGGEEILPSHQKQIIEQVEFTYSSLGKLFEKQIKTTEDQEKKLSCGF